MGAVLFAVVDTGEIYSSADGGAGWDVLATIPASDAVGLAAGISSGQLFLATRSGTIYGSEDAGQTWVAVGAVGASDVTSFTINPDLSLVAATESGTVYLSEDAGVSFAGIGSVVTRGLVSLTRGPMGRLFALSRTGEVYESQNDGQTWSAVGNVPVSNAVSLRPRGNDLYILTRTGEVFQSPDFGSTWTPIGAITASDMRAILDLGSSLVAVSDTGEVYGSVSGSGWSAVGSVQQLRVMSLGVDTPLATGIPEDRTLLPRFAVRAPFPNPGRLGRGSSFAVETTGPEHLRLDLYDIRGRRVASAPGEFTVSEGVDRIHWSPAGISPGVYFLRVTTASGYRATVKWSLVR